MSQQRTPAYQSQRADKNLAQLSQFDSDSSLNRPVNSGEGTLTPSMNITQRNKRTKEVSSPNQLNIFKEEIMDLITSLIGGQNRELEAINNKLQAITESNAKIDDAISILSAQNEEYRGKIADLEKRSLKDREYITILEDKVEDLQRTSRKTCLEIRNVPKKSQESREELIQMAISLSKSIHFPLNDRDINDIHRVKSKGAVEKKPTIIVEFRSCNLKIDFLKKVKDFNLKNKTRLQAKHLGFTSNEDTPIFVTEHLTSKGARLFFLARDLKRAQKVKYCWTSMGKVLVRKDDTSKIVLIQHEAQVQQLMQEP